MSHAAAAAVSVAALLSTALTHTVQITGASVVTPLSAPLPSSSQSGWMISWLRDIGSLCSREFASPLPDSFRVCRLWGKERGREERQGFLFQEAKSGYSARRPDVCVFRKGEMKRE